MIEVEPKGLLVQLLNEVVRQAENLAEREAILAADAASRAPEQPALFAAAMGPHPTDRIQEVPNGLDPTK
jgi:hypothetical protein